jgi:hypothetical protein
VEEIPRIVYHAPTLRQRKSLDVPRINVQASGALPPPPTGTPMQTQTQMSTPMQSQRGMREKNRLSQSHSQETLTLQDLQREELQSRRPKSVQPTKQVRKEIKEEGKEKKGRWDAYAAIFGSGREKEQGREGKENRDRDKDRERERERETVREREAVKKERISRPRAVGVERLAYGTPVVRKVESTQEYYAPVNGGVDEREEWRPENMRRVGGSTKDTGMRALHSHAGVGFGSVRVHG